MRLSPVLKQCFATTGVLLNTAAMGFILSFTVVLEQLKVPGSLIPIDDEEFSWIASVPGMFTFIGAIVVIPIMGRYGRRTANLVSISILIVSWAGIATAPNIAILLLARALQGISLGMTSTFGSILIGEYTSPRKRGVFLMTISVSIGLGIMFAHALTSFMNWQNGALVCGVIAIVDLVVVFLSPESPSWLASKGRYGKCKKAFRWLRDDTEEEELNKLISTFRFVHNLNETVVSESIVTKVRKKLFYFQACFRKPEFYKPLIIACHLYLIYSWCGIDVIIGYPGEYLVNLNDSKGNIAIIVTSMDLHKILASILAVYIIKKIKRRIMLLAAVSMNVIALLAIAAYSYAREHYTLPFDHPMIGILLTHFLIFAISAGSLPLSRTIPGEIFPLRDKSLAGGIGIIFMSVFLSVSYKIIPFCLVKLGICWFFCIQAFLLIYCVIVVLYILPETKDRTLQDIEDEFRGKPLWQEPQTRNRLLLRETCDVETTSIIM